MLTWLIIALVGALIFGLLGFTKIASGFASIAKIIFYIFIIVLIVTFIMNLME